MKLSRAAIPDLSVLQAFECAARHSSFTRAAEELNLTQSAVSRQIRSLEDQLGVGLFERVRKRVVLTDPGKALLSDVEALLNKTEEVVLKALATADGKKVLSIATLPTFASRWLMRRLPSFIEQHPGTILQVTSRPEPFDFASQPFDLAIHYGQPVWPKATCTYLFGERIVPVGSPALIARRQFTQPQDLTEAPLLHLETRPRLWAEWFELTGCQIATAYRGNRFDQFNMIIEAACAGLGVALLPIYLIQQEIKSGSLQVIFENYLTTENNYYIAVPEGRQTDALAISFRNWVLDQIARTPADSV